MAPPRAGSLGRAATGGVGAGRAAGAGRGVAFCRSAGRGCGAGEGVGVGVGVARGVAAAAAARLAWPRLLARAATEPRALPGSGRATVRWGSLVRRSAAGRAAA